jgi:hypothetical protein
MQSMDRGQADRMRLVCRVQVAYEDLRAVQQDDSHSRKARLAAAAAKRKFALLNRALAMMALEAAS